MKNFLVVLGAILVLGQGLWAAEKKEGKITISYLEGGVEVLKKQEKDWKKAKLYVELSAGDRIRTLLSAKCDLKLSDGSIINIKENSIMDITQLLEEGAKTNSSFKLWMGEIKARVQRLKTKDSSMSFHTPTAVMGLRGTTVWLTVDWRGRTRCGFTEGNGYIYTDKDGEKAVNKGEEAEVSLEGDIEVKRTEQITVPNLIGMQLSEAKTAVTTARLVIGQTRAEESTKPQDEVLSQDPKPGISLPKYGEVNVVVAIPIPPIVVPDLIGMTRASAEAKIAEERLAVGSIFEDYDEIIPINTVMKQNPQAGIEVKEGASIDLLISKGPYPKSIVPNLLGKTISEAETLLTNAKLNLGQVLEIKRDMVAEGRIVDQEPNAGTRVKQGSFVKVWKAVPVPEQRVRVPNLIGMDIEKAKAKIKAEGLKLGNITKKASDERGGTVWKQDPTAGTEVILETAVDLTVTKPGKPVIHYQFSTAEKFVTEIPSLNLHITPNNPNWAPLSLNIAGRLIKLSAPPYYTTYKPAGVSIGNNVIRVSAKFEEGEEVTEEITMPCYDPISPTIVSVSKVRKGVMRLTVRDKESGIKNVRVAGRLVAPISGTQEKRAGLDLYIEAVYEIEIPSNFSSPTIKIEVTDNAGNKKEKNVDEAPYTIPPPNY
ncbi:MAG: PASTA domain-containing protein [bacterium]|nr:PASTA domain-containing protein [bacterium]